MLSRYGQRSRSNGATHEWSKACAADETHMRSSFFLADLLPYVIPRPIHVQLPFFCVWLTETCTGAFNETTLICSVVVAP